MSLEMNFKAYSLHTVAVCSVDFILIWLPLYIKLTQLAAYSKLLPEIAKHTVIKTESDCLQ